MVSTDPTDSNIRMRFGLNLLFQTHSCVYSRLLIVSDFNNCSTISGYLLVARVSKQPQCILESRWMMLLSLLGWLTDDKSQNSSIICLMDWANRMDKYCH